MKTLFALLVTFVAVLIPNTAQALPTASFTASPTVTAGVPSVYDASASVCDIEPCTYEWRYYRTSSPDRLGTTLGKGKVINAAIYESPGQRFTVVLKVINGGSTHGFTTAQKSVTVS